MSITYWLVASIEKKALAMCLEKVRSSSNDLSRFRESLFKISSNRDRYDTYAARGPSMTHGVRQAQSQQYAKQHWRAWDTNGNGMQDPQREVVQLLGIRSVTVEYQHDIIHRLGTHSRSEP